MKKLELLVSSILAGLLIGMSGAIYLGSGKIPFGAVLFSVALFTICTRGMALFTGRVGYLVTRHDRMVCIGELLVIWLGNLDWMCGDGAGGCVCKTGLSGDGVRADGTQAV